MILLDSVAPPSPQEFLGVTNFSNMDSDLDHGGTPVEKTFETWQTGAFLVIHAKKKSFFSMLLAYFCDPDSQL